MRALAGRRSKRLCWAATAVLASASSVAYAEPLRLRSDALVQTRTPAPVGLLVLRGENHVAATVDAETVTWVGVTSDPTGTGDVLTLSVRVRDPESGSEVRAGRLLVSMGAIRPLHLDGARGLVRVFGGTTVEAFAGFPVVRRFDYATFDVAAGGRIGQAVGDTVAVGASYLQRRRDGLRADEEVGADFALTPRPWLTAAGRAAFDVGTSGPTDALVSVSIQNATTRAELFSFHRSPGRLLPSTSLFSMLGDFASTNVGATGRWRMFPRLELVATGSAQVQAEEWGGQGLGRATLALDDDWDATVGVELRRVDVGTTRWSGARVLAGMPLTARVRIATEIEMVVPDRPRGAPWLWPWALGAVSYRIADAWDVAAGVEASSGPTDRAAVHGLARATYVFDRREARR